MIARGAPFDDDRQAVLIGRDLRRRLSAAGTHGMPISPTPRLRPLSCPPSSSTEPLSPRAISATTARDCHEPTRRLPGCFAPRAFMKGANRFEPIGTDLTRCV
jgi:hypothetical protein